MKTVAGIWCGLVFASLAAASARADADARDPARWVPADAMAYFGIVDIGELKQAWHRTVEYQMTQDPQLKALLDELPSSWNKLLEQLRERIAKVLGTEPEQIQNPFGGGLALFIMPATSQQVELPVRAALAVGVADQARMRAYYRQAVRRLRDRVNEYERQEFADERIDVFIRGELDPSDQDSAHQDANKPADDDTPLDLSPSVSFNRLLDRIFRKDSLPPRLAMCLTDERLIVATDEALIKGVLRGWKSSPTLAEADEYRYLLRKFEPAGQVRMLISMPRVVDAIRQQDDAAAALFASMGIDNIRSVLAHIRYGERDYDSRLDVLVHTEGEPRGLVRIFAMPNRPVQPTRFVPDDTAFYLSLNLDFQRLFDEIERMLRQRDPAAADAFIRSLTEVTTPDGQTINLKDQLFANLGAPLEVLWRFSPPYGPETVRVALRVPIRNADQIRGVLRAVGPSAGLTERDLEGATVFDLAFGGISIGVQEAQLVAGVQAAVERAMQQAETVAPLATSKRFKAVARFVPQGAWGLFYSDGERILKAMLGMARKRKEFETTMFTNPLAGMGQVMAAALSESIPPEKLDDAARMAEYQSVELLTVSSSPDGVWLRAIQVPIKRIRPAP